ncbi:MAG TPA: ribose 5-phosphate isomerase B [Planctomycetaceae bacterium]|nr:ribose 5-phosphate isomerase B [Planctomycetaceae bacterium]
MNSGASEELRTLAIGGDHAGYNLKSIIVGELAAWGYTIKDCGPENDSPCDFPDFAEKVCSQVVSGQAQRGLLVCGSGVGVCVAANKFPGIRASICHDTYSARQGVEHDDMNVLCIGARIVGQSLATELVRSFLNATYSPETRHARRVEKILDIETRALAGKLS